MGHATKRNAFNWMFNQINKTSTPTTISSAYNAVVDVVIVVGGIVVNEIWFDYIKMKWAIVMHCACSKLRAPFWTEWCGCCPTGLHFVHFSSRAYFTGIGCRKVPSQRIPFNWNGKSFTSATDDMCLFVCIVWPKSFSSLSLLALAMAVQDYTNVVLGFRITLLLFALWCPDDWCNWIL